jgi:hypothetical protein
MKSLIDITSLDLENVLLEPRDFKDFTTGSGSAKT